MSLEQWILLLLLQWIVNTNVEPLLYYLTRTQQHAHNVFTANFAAHVFVMLNEHLTKLLL